MTKDGYVAINHKLQHRMIMESILGRPLYAHERVKHINGNKADNRVENLLLTSSLKPKSNSVEDKIAWAKEFLAVYDSI